LKSPGDPANVSTGLTSVQRGDQLSQTIRLAPPWQMLDECHDVETEVVNAIANVVTGKAKSLMTVPGWVSP